MSRAETLYRLQLLDSEMDKAVKRAREIDAALKENQAVAHCKRELAAISAVLTRATSEFKLLELDAKGLETKTREEEERLYGGKIKASKEMVDVQHEVDSLKRRRAALDEKVMEAELAVDEARSTERNIQAALADATGKWQQDSVGIKKELADLRLKYAGLTEQRKAFVATIAAADQTTYANLRSKKPNGVAVSIVANAVCGSCGEAPSSHGMQQAKLGPGLVTCGNCGRILHAM